MALSPQRVCAVVWCLALTMLLGEPSPRGIHHFPGNGTILLTRSVIEYPNNALAPSNFANSAGVPVDRTVRWVKRQRARSHAFSLPLSLVLLRRPENAIEDMAKPHSRFEETAPYGRCVSGNILRIDCHCPLGLAYLEGGVISGILTGGADLHAVFDVRRNRNLVRLLRPGNHVPLGPGLPVPVGQFGT